MFQQFFKTYTRRCPDGTVKTVYRNVNDAFPLFLPGWKAKIGGDLKVPLKGQAAAKAEYETKIQGLLFGLNELNEGLTMTFRSAYVAYQADPCSGYPYLMHIVHQTISEQQRLLKIKVQVDGLVALSKSLRGSGGFIEMYKSIVAQIGGPLEREAAVIAIRDSTSDVTKWIGGSDAS